METFELSSEQIIERDEDIDISDSIQESKGKNLDRDAQEDSSPLKEEKHYKLRRRSTPKDENICLKVQRPARKKKIPRKTFAQRQLKKLRNKFLPMEAATNDLADLSPKENYFWSLSLLPL